MIKRKKSQIILVFLVSTLFFIQFSLAITATSGNYSIGMFGNGMAIAEPSSTNYETTALSEVKGTTRNAESDSFLVNVGFFDNVSYSRTVSITSYSISPSSAVVGSTIGLYISALNSESIWAEITSPNSQQQTINLINGQTVNFVPSPSVVGTYTVTFYANSSIGAIASVISSFEFTAQPATPPSGGGGGGGTTRIIEECSYNWDCTPWGLCADGKQTRTCKNIGTCEGNESKPIEEMGCSKSLFDISLKLEDIIITQNKTLKFKVNLIEKMGAGKIDAHIKYSIMDIDHNEFFSQIETKAIYKDLFYEKEIKEINLDDGEYTLRVDILYGELQRAFAEQTLKIKNGEIIIKEITPEDIPDTKRISITGEIIKKLSSSNWELALTSFIIIIIMIFLIIIRKKITSIYNKICRYLIGSKKKTKKHIKGLMIGVGGKMTLAHAAAVKHISKLKRSSKKYPKDSLKGLINKKVYSEGGDYIGKIKEIYLGENKIDGLKIKLNKRKKSKIKGVIINYKDVNTGNVVIIGKKAYKKIEKEL